MPYNVSNDFGRLPSRIKDLSFRVLGWSFPAAIAASALHYRNQAGSIAAPIGTKVVTQIKAVPSAIVIILCIGAVCSAATLLPGMFSFIRRTWNSWRGGIPVGLSTAWFVCLGAIFLALIEHRWVTSILVVGIGLTATAFVLLAGAIRLPVSAAGMGTTDADLPISAWGEDILARSPLVDILANTILLDHPSVLAISAPFGSGKSSVLNLLELELGNDKSILVVRFSSWLPGSQEALVMGLFKAIIDGYGKQLLVPSLRSRLIE